MTRPLIVFAIDANQQDKNSDLCDDKSPPMATLRRSHEAAPHTDTCGPQTAPPNIAGRHQRRPAVFACVRMPTTRPQVLEVK